MTVDCNRRFKKMNWNICSGLNLAIQRDQKVFSISNGKKMREVNEFGYYQTAFPSFLISDDLM